MLYLQDKVYALGGGIYGNVGTDTVEELDMASRTVLRFCQYNAIVDLKQHLSTNFQHLLHIRRISNSNMSRSPYMGFQNKLKMTYGVLQNESSVTALELGSRLLRR